MDDPLEASVEVLLKEQGLNFTRPERDPEDPTALDFYIPSLDLYIEVKQFHTDRIAKQLSKVPKDASVMVLVGPGCVDALWRLLAREARKA